MNVEINGADTRRIASPIFNLGAIKAKGKLMATAKQIFLASDIYIQTVSLGFMKVMPCYSPCIFLNHEYERCC